MAQDTDTAMDVDRPSPRLNGSPRRVGIDFVTLGMFIIGEHLLPCLCTPRSDHMLRYIIYRRDTLPTATTTCPRYTRRCRILLCPRRSHILLPTRRLEVGSMDSRLWLGLPTGVAAIPCRLGDILLNEEYTRKIDDEGTQRIWRE
jgi:hypothetical protein